MLTVEEISTALLAYADANFDWDSYSEYINYYDSQRGTQYEIAGLGTVTVVDYNTYDSDKNYNGWSENLWIIFEVQGELYRAVGSYTSFSGSEWEQLVTSVVPKEKIVIEYVDKDAS